MHWLRGLDFGEAITQMTYKLCEVVNLDGGQGDIKASEKQEVSLNLLVKVIATGNDQCKLVCTSKCYSQLNYTSFKKIVLCSLFLDKKVLL